MQCTIIIFGATGDLTKRKLIPAIYKLHLQGKIDVQIIAIGRRSLSDHQIRNDLKTFIKDTAKWAEFSQRIFYHKLEFHDADGYDTLKAKLKMTENRLFYLATAPESFPIIIKHLNRTGIAERNPKTGWHRVVFEKPFGYDLLSAKKLNKEIITLFNEKQVYRIDHYLGKELVQNILVLRFTNPIFEHLWSSKYIDNIQLVVVENEGVLDRGGYYDKSGALRDIVQNHLLQLLALTAMEMPKSVDAEAIRDEKVRALKAIVLESAQQLRKNVVFGQYTSGSIDGKKIPNYRNEKDVAKDSNTETFAAIKLRLANQRWRNVPFYVRTGKALQHKYAEIVITFKAAPCKLFCGPTGKLAANKLVIRIQPDEGVKLQFNLKEQNTDYSALPYTMDFSHAAEFGMNTTEAYERLLYDVARGDQTLFTRWDEVAQAWKIIDNIRKAKIKSLPYPAGTHGPAAALDLVQRDGRDWYGNQAVKQFK